MMNRLRFFLYLGLVFTCPFMKRVQAQSLQLNLQKVIHIANDSSLEAFRVKNLYLRGYWEYRSFKAGRLPSLTLNVTPAKYNRDIVQRYVSDLDMDVYRTQQSLFSYGNLAIQQNFDLTGGTFYIDSELSFLRYFGATNTTQYSSVPIRIGYSQNLIGYNSFRWEKKIEPLKYEKVKKELVYNMENVAEQATSYFFALAMAQAEHKLAEENLKSCSNLYRMGEQRHELAGISKADLLTLKLEVVNAQNTLLTTASNTKRAMFSLASFLNLPKDTEIALELPGKPGELSITPTIALEKARENNPEFLQQRQNVLEAERDLDRTKRQRYFEANVSASIGFNQVASSLKGAYIHPMQQDMVSIGVTVPIIDWGVRKGKYNMAKNNLNVVKTAARQEELSVEEEVIMTVNDFNIQQNIVSSAEEALDLAILAYQETRERFIIGKSDINSLTLALNRQQEAQEKYISALRNYWMYYYKIRRLTLYNFELNITLTDKFEMDLNGWIK